MTDNTNGSSYSPLCEMRTTGPARMDWEGCIVDSGEYVAALYETYAADHEWVDAMQERYGSAVVYPTPPVNSPLASMGDYCTTAQRVAEDLWTRDVEDVTMMSETEYDRYVNWV